MKKLDKIIAIANDTRGNEATRRVALRMLWNLGYTNKQGQWVIAQMPDFPMDVEELQIIKYKQWRKSGRLDYIEEYERLERERKCG
jgi:hypothetical protein